jgi:hypothetical protein
METSSILGSLSKRSLYKSESAVTEGEVAGEDAVGRSAAGRKGVVDWKRGAKGAEPTIAGSKELLLLIGSENTDRLDAIGHRCLDLTAELEIYDGLVSKLEMRLDSAGTNLS